MNLTTDIFRGLVSMSLYSLVRIQIINLIVCHFLNKPAFQ